MIIPNLVVGKDVYGHDLKCGDICSFDIELERPKCGKNIEKMMGMIIYDEDSYAFAFETLDNYAPLLLMYCAELRSIEKLFSASLDNFDNIPHGSDWKEIYNNNVKMF